MLIHYARCLTQRERSGNSNQQLGLTLAFIAGATNVGGLMALEQYTSHVTGIVSTIAADLSYGAYGMVLSGLVGLLSFLLGAISCTLMVNFAQSKQMESTYAFPLFVEACLLLSFGLLGARLAAINDLFVPLTVMLLCFVMGLQNAVVTKLSGTVIRTTHVTGMVTDIGIELGKLAYRNFVDIPRQKEISADKDRLKILLLMVMFFFAGGVTGALGFIHLSYFSVVPLALALLALAIVPIIDDALFLLKRLPGK